MLGIDNQYLNPTPIIDSDHKKVIEYAQDTISDAGKDPIAQAIKLYYAVRDGIWYDPYYTCSIVRSTIGPAISYGARGDFV